MFAIHLNTNSSQHEACRQHYQKIRRESKNYVAGNEGLSAPQTPVKAKGIKSAKVTPAKRGSKSSNAVNSALQSDDEEGKTPVGKRQKIEEIDEEPEEEKYEVK